MKTEKIEFFAGPYRFLSNFHPSPIFYEGISFPTVEHAYQAAKTEDVLDREIISKTTSPAAAKRMGRNVKMRSDWEVIKIDIMLELVSQKFENLELRRSLLATGDDELIEGNTWGDTFWGKVNGVGHNELGNILMYVRARLRRQG